MKYGPLTMELLKAIHEFEKEYGSRPENLLIREDILNTVQEECDKLHTEMGIDVVKFKAGFMGISLEVKENIPESILPTPEFELNAVVNGEHCWLQRVKFPEIPKYMFGVVEFQDDL